MPRLTKKQGLIGLVGTIAAGILYTIVPQFEGKVNAGYLDPIGIATKCYGDTNDVVVGQHYTDAQCNASLEKQLIAHAQPVLACTPILENYPYQLAAAVSFAYNIGATAYCNSTTAKRFNKGDFQGACKAINESDQGHLQWVSAGGRVLPGLLKRRAVERAICERGFVRVMSK